MLSSRPRNWNVASLPPLATSRFLLLNALESRLEASLSEAKAVKFWPLLER